MKHTELSDHIDLLHSNDKSETEIIKEVLDVILEFFEMPAINIFDIKDLILRGRMKCNSIIEYHLERQIEDVEDGIKEYIERYSKLD